MSKCWRVSRVALSEFVDGMLADDKKAWLGEHLAGCSGCSDAVRELQALKKEVAGLPSLSLSANCDWNRNTALLEARREAKAAVAAAVRPQPAPRRTVVLGLPRPMQAFAVALLSVTAAVGIYSLLSPGPGVRLASASGTVEIRRTQQSGWETAAVGIRLNPGDEVRTGRGGEAVFQAGRVYQAKLAEQSEWVPIELAAARGGKSAYFVLKRGTLMVRTGPGFRGRSMRVEGPSGKAEVVGTSFMMKALPDGKTALSVAHGNVEMLGKRPGDAGKVKVGRLEETAVAPKGTPSLPRPMGASDWKQSVEFEGEAASSATVAELKRAVDSRAKLTPAEAKRLEDLLLAEADRELAGYGFYLLGSAQEELMAPAEALQQYVSVLAHFPDTLESAWAAQFLRSRLDLVPSDADAMGEEISGRQLEEPLKEVPSARGLTPEFLKGLEPQRRFILMQMELGKENDAWSSVVERAITLERDLGEKNYRVAGYLDHVRNRATGEMILKIGKLFNRDEKGRLVEVNTAVFHPGGNLIYTVDRKNRYQGNTAAGYTETYKGPDARLLATLERKVEQRSRSGAVLRYVEIWRNSRGELLLERKRTDIRYDPQGKVAGYQDELVDLDRRLVLEKGVAATAVEVGRERLLKVAETPVATMDEMLQKLRELRRSGASLPLESPYRDGTQKPTL